MSLLENVPHGLPQSVVSQLRIVFSQYPQIESVTLYGSRAMGNYRQGSDIDLCINGPGLSLSQLFMIENAIDDLLLPWKIDLSLRHKIDNQSLLEHINRVGVAFYKANSG